MNVQTISRAATSGTTLPATDRSDPVRGGSTPVPHTIRVLCVDDHALLVEGLAAQFSIEGKAEVVGRLASAEPLLDEVKRLRPTAVMLDIEIPGPDAFEMADRLKRTYPEVKVIVLSGHIRDAYITASLAARVDGYFAKSDELADIVNGIYDIVNSTRGAFVLGPKIRERCRPIMAGDLDRSSRRRKGMPGAIEGGPVTLLSTLSTRETEILRLVGKGLSRQQIAEQIFRSVKTIDGHQDRIMKKLGITTRSELMRFAIREGLAEA